MAVLKKNAKGYGYKYTDIAEINSSLAEMGIEYYQYIERIDGEDYIITVPIIDGEEKPARRGCKIGSGITYARRYSLLMAFGLATTDDDAQCMTREKEDTSRTGFPSRDSMIKLAKSHYPDGSENLGKLLQTFNAESIEALTDEQLKAVYGKFRGK